MSPHPNSVGVVSSYLKFSVGHLAQLDVNRHYVSAIEMHFMGSCTDGFDAQASGSRNRNRWGSSTQQQRRTRYVALNVVQR